MNDMDKVLCPLCNSEAQLFENKKDNYFVKIDKRSKEMMLYEMNDYLAVFSINYCPICGKKLKRNK